MEHRFHCIIKLLDEQVESINVEFQRDSKGQFLLDQACDALRLAEREYFGLRYVDQHKQRHWLDCKKNALKQLKGTGPPYRVVFRVKFYPADPYSLKEEITRFQLFQQLKRDLLHGRLVCSFHDEALLGACIVQSNLEDYNPEEHLPGYVSFFTMCPKQTEKLQIRIEELHRTEMKGLEPPQAEFRFIETAHKLDTYGVDPHVVRDMYGTQLYIALTFRGVLLFRGSMLAETFKWDTIRKFSQDGRALVIHAIFNEKKVNHRYWLTTESGAEHLWKCAIENQGFYQSRVTKGLKRSNSFLRRNRYSFSGTTQKEALEHSTHLERKEPRVARSPPLIRPRRSLQANSLRPISDASTFEGFSSHLAAHAQNHSTPQRDSELPSPQPQLPLFTLASPDSEDDDVSSTDAPSTTTNTTSPLISFLTSAETPGEVLAGAPLPDVVEEEEVVVDEGVCDVHAPHSPAMVTSRADSNHEMDRILADMLEKTQAPSQPKGGDSAISHAYSFLLVLLLTLLTVLLLLFVLFETDLPIVQPLQDAWPVDLVHHHYYAPVRAWTVGRWRDFTGTFIAPASQYVTRQVDTIITNFKS